VGESQIKIRPHMLFRDYMRSLTGMGATIVMDPTVAALLKRCARASKQRLNWANGWQECGSGCRHIWGRRHTTAMMPMALQGWSLMLPGAKHPCTLINPLLIQVGFKLWSQAEDPDHLVCKLISDSAGEF